MFSEVIGQTSSCITASRSRERTMCCGIVEIGYFLVTVRFTGGTAGGTTGGATGGACTLLFVVMGTKA